ncbi:glycosyltransferase [Gordonia sp. zg691]|uniref:glycosyltransferase n=1 Tax=Gordonia jinghuaiqii TaxID=2758710 RepID=UPI0016621CC2|nr:glycosyltransferase [Gordonia jinghuaiqii]MBD0863958.1 glycosyltransferase [Gordonia jinghuaiqii]
MTEQQERSWSAATDAGRRLLLIASTGGHLAQLDRLAEGLRAADSSLWVTFDTTQSRALLRGRNVLHVPYIEPRDGRTALAVYRQLARELPRHKPFEQAISTGAALALPGLLAARRHGIPGLYIESVSRTDGPSLTGKMLAATHLVELETQHPRWSTRRWTHRRTVLDSYESVSDRDVAVPPRGESGAPAPRLFVTLGTIRPYKQDPLIQSLLKSGLDLSNTVWQLGSSYRTDLPGEIHRALGSEEMDKNILGADVVITHAGVGSIMRILELGKYPVVVPRRRSRGEHVDDHQTQIAGLVGRLGLAEVAEAPDLTAENIWRAMGKRVITAEADQ